MQNRKYSTFKLSLLSFLNTKIQIMRKIVVVMKMHIQFILFSILFHNLNQFHIIFKIPLQALASWECDCIFPADRAGQSSCLVCFHSSLSLQSSTPPCTSLAIHPDHGTLFPAFHLESKVQGDSQDWCGKAQSFTACSPDCLALSFRQNYFIYPFSRLHISPT